MRDKLPDAGGERGYLMVGVVLIIALMLIFSTIAFQSWDDVVRRDNEAEMMARAQEIVRAMVRYRKDNGTTPDKLELLIEPGPRGQYYLRHLYKDPLVKDGKWGLLYLGAGGEIVDPNATELPGEEADDPFASLKTSIDREGERGGRKGGRGGKAAGGLRVSGVAAGRAEWAQAQPSDPRLEGKESISGGVQLNGLRLAGVKSLCTDKPFRVYKGSTEYALWLFTILDLVQTQAPGAPPDPAPSQPGKIPGQDGEFGAGHKGPGRQGSPPAGGGRGGGRQPGTPGANRGGGGR